MSDSPSSLVPHPSHLVDTHAHLDDASFDADREAVLARATEAGVAAVVCPGITAASSVAAVRLAGAHEGVFAAVGIQPNYGAEAAEGDWDRIVALAGRPRVLAVGETGLDRHWDFTPFDLQRQLFDRHLRLARDRGLPVIVHCREAEDDVLAALREAARPGPVRGVLHAFSGGPDLARECIGLGLHVSFAGPVTYTNKKFDLLREAVAAVRDDRLLIETDSPYLTPHPLRGKLKRNEPCHVRLVAQAVAAIRGQSPEHVAAVTSANARRLFALS